MSNEIINQPFTYGDSNRVIWNISTWNQNNGYVTLSTLKSYANLYKINVFTSLNVFASVVSQNINGVNESVFEYLKNITSDVQENFNNIFNRISSIQYFTDNQTTHISNNTYCDNLGSNDIEAQIINVSNINKQQLNTFSIRTNELKSNTITAQRINHNFDIGLFLVIDGFYITTHEKSDVTRISS